MKRIAFVFTRGPHGSSGGREGLDVLLAVSALNKSLDVFFISDGVLQLLPNQNPEKILARNYIATFGLLKFYDVQKFYFCSVSLKERGLTHVTDWVLDAKALSPNELRSKMSMYDIIITC